MWCSALPSKSRCWCRARCLLKARPKKSRPTKTCARFIWVKRGTREAIVPNRALELDKVFAGYGLTVILEDICLTLDVGETLSIIGRNGVGKSTLLATIMGHTTLHGGAIRLHGKNASHLVTYRRVTAGLGYVP